MNDLMTLFTESIEYDEPVSWEEYEPETDEPEEKHLIEKADPAEELLEQVLDQQSWWRLPDIALQLMGILKEGYEQGALREMATMQEQVYALGHSTTTTPAEDFNLTNPYVLKLLEDHAALTVQRVNDGTKFYLRQKLVSGTREGLSPEEIMKDIQANLFNLPVAEQEKLPESRIRSIVNTELNWAYSRAAVDQHKTTGFKKGHWTTRQYDVCDL